MAAAWLDAFEYNFWHVYECEDGQLGGLAGTSSSQVGHAGTGYVVLPSTNSYFDLLLENQRTVGGHDLWLRYSNPATSDLPLKVEVNGRSVTSFTLSLPPTEMCQQL